MENLIAKCDTEHIVLQVDISEKENATIASQHHMRSSLLTGAMVRQLSSLDMHGSRHR